ncbi:MAG TPA: fumarylacetoacetate hydrolase family protein [Candidatus Micrarchaeia archaeon]|nr:fumarylacetoacetate hydrolase family protein [Candidatus Micrarchaeia archaeon]
MRVVRYRADGGSAYGILEDGLVRRLDGPVFEGPLPGPVVGELDTLHLLAPCQPSKAVCVGRNYHGLLAVQGRPVPTQPFTFLKSPNAVVGPGHPILRPHGVERLVYEGELTVVIGRTLASPGNSAMTPLQDWQRYVFGYTCGNDVTALDWQDQTVQWARAKSADSFCPIGPWIETDLGDPGHLAVRTTVNGELRQDGSTADMVFGIPALLSFISATLTLSPGDVILTGTPPGAAPLADGDVVEVELEGIGRLSNPVARGR